MTLLMAIPISAAMPGIKITQINLHRSHHSKAELDQRLSDIALITEPPLNKRKEPSLSFSGYTVHFNANSPRTAIRTNNQLVCNLVPAFSSGDVTTICVQINHDKHVYVSSVYLDILEEIPGDNSMLSQLVQHCQAEEIPLVIGADSNAHSVLWGCVESNQRGEEMETFLETHNLSVLNVGQTPTFNRNDQHTIIDITLTNVYGHRQLMVDNWKVDSDCSFSDHSYITFDIAGPEPTQRMRRNLRKVHWDGFRRDLQKVKFNDDANIEVRADVINSRINE